MSRRYDDPNPSRSPQPTSPLQHLGGRGYQNIAPPPQPTLPSFTQGRQQETAYEPYRRANTSPPPPPQHSQDYHDQMSPQQIQNQDFSPVRGMGAGQQRNQNSLSMASNVTPGADNWGSSAGGGLEGLAMNVADNRPRESGVEAVRGIPQNYLPEDGRQPRLPALGEEPLAIARPAPAQRGYSEGSNPFEGEDERYRRMQQQGGQERYDRSRSPYHDDQYGPQPPHQRNNPQIMVGGAPLLAPGEGHGHPAQAHSGQAAGAVYAQGQPGYGYDTEQDAVLNRYSQRIDPGWQVNDPNAIADDDDDGLGYGKMKGKYSTAHNDASQFSLAPSSTGTGHGTRNAALDGAAAGGLLGGLLGRSGANTPGSGADIPLYGAQPAMSMQSINGGSGGTNADAERYARNAQFLREEKASKLAAQKAKKRKCVWITVSVVAFLVVAAIVGAVVGTMLTNKNKDNTTGKPSGDGAKEDLATNGDLGKDSKEIKAILANPDLHKVFPGMDYTPMSTQYPDCLHYLPSQNNVTRDIAVLSKLTNVVRLYGTDCNQTQMVLHAIDRLELKDEMKVWLGVWQDKNTTTNARQLAQMYQVLEEYGDAYFNGVIIGNEMLFREDITIPELSKLVTGVKANFTRLGYKALPIATSDLGDAWTQDLADAVDVLMANIHPFFTGKPIRHAAEFTWQFWQWQNFPLKRDPASNFIGETGWPTKGGTACGYDANVTVCDDGSVAGIPELNQFMDDWVCQALANGTNYFWFEAFDEPWKIKYNEAGKEWEDQWGLMDVNRKLKPGVKIPDCGGKTIG